MKRIYPHLVCHACGWMLAECPHCKDRDEYALFCLNPACKETKPRPKGLSRSQRLEAKKREAGQCIKCPLGSPKLLKGTLCVKHRTGLRERWAKVEARKEMQLSA